MGWSPSVMDLRVSTFVEKLSPEPEFHKQSENNTGRLFPAGASGTEDKPLHPAALFAVVRAFQLVSITIRHGREPTDLVVKVCSSGLRTQI